MKKQTTESKRKKLIKDLDTLTSLIVRVRDKRCVCCGSMERLTDGHLITRNCKIIRWDLTNNNCQCASCNFTHEFRPERYTEWWIKKYGLEAYEELVAQSKLTKKWTIEELENIKISLKELLEELK